MIYEATRRLDEGALRALVPRVLAGLVRRGEDFDAVVALNLRPAPVDSSALPCPRALAELAGRRSGKPA